jgi:two-component system chemotaxis response regulator CheB
MDRIRVIAIDDSSVARRLITNAIEMTSDLEVVGTASNGRLGLSKLERVPCDLVVLDVEMPELGGIETLREIRKRYPKLPVIMFSSLTRRGAETTLDALASGANDYVAKPRASGPDAARMEVARELFPKIRALCPQGTRDLAPSSAPRPTLDLPPPPVPPPPRRAPLRPRRPLASSAHRRPAILGIGCSTGGPNALADIIPSLPGPIGVPVVVVQHMPPIFTRLMAERLDARSQVRVREATHGEALLADTVYVAPGDFHMEVSEEHRVVLHQQPPENSCRPAVDVLFRSMARVFGARSVGVILTGMGRDGYEGSRLLKEAGASLLVQDKETSVVWGMPGFISRAGLADRELPLSEMAGAIQEELGLFPARARG